MLGSGYKARGVGCVWETLKHRLSQDQDRKQQQELRPAAFFSAVYRLFGP